MSDSSNTVGSTGLRSYEAYLQEQASKTRTPVQDLGQNEFLKLLVTQMQYQDPLEPTTDTAFVAQMAQFSSLNELTALNSTISNLANMQAYSLAGRYVVATVTLDTGDPATIAGIVDRVVMINGAPWVQVGEYMVDASKISEVYDSELFNYGNTLLEASSLIGRSVKAYIVPEEEGAEKIAVEGVIERVAFEDGAQVAYLNTGEVDESGNAVLTRVNITTIYDISK